MEFRLLGPLTVLGAEGPLTIGGARERALLSRLLLDPGRPVRVGVLVEELWPGGADGAARSLQVRVSSLRRQLGDEAPIVRAGGGYAIEVAPNTVDLHRFERLVSDAERAAPEAVLALTDQALALWTGPPLTELGDSPTAVQAVERLEGLHARARLLRARALLDLGRPTEAEAFLAELVADQPLHESAVVLLVEAVYAAGRPADALRIRQTALDQLAELGLDPSPALRDADVAVLRHELPGGPGIGVAPVTAAPPSRPRAAAPPGGRLPGSSAPFLGRAGDRARIAERFRGGARLVTLWGPGGVGKTRLAVAVATDLADELPTPPVLLDGTRLATAEELPDALAELLGATAGEPTADALAASLQGRRLLVVLDNLEHLLAAGPFLAELLAAAPGLQLLVTSRTVPGCAARRSTGSTAARGGQGVGR